MTSSNWLTAWEVIILESCLREQCVCKITEGHAETVMYPTLACLSQSSVEKLSLACQSNLDAVMGKLGTTWSNFLLDQYELCLAFTKFLDK